MADTESRHCWIDVFELSHFRGRRRRLYGPAGYPSARSRLPSWGISIDSLIVGPEAYVRFYSHAHPQSLSHWLMPQQVCADIIELNIGDDIDCFDIFRNPPGLGDAGYAAFAELWKKAQKTE